MQLDFGWQQRRPFVDEGAKVEPHIVPRFALAAKTLAGFSLSPCHPAVGTAAVAPRVNERLKVNFLS